jgi:tetratricopeptide (TPR) repeat protein
MLGKFLGKYRIEAELGSGGMGRVWLARDEDGSAVALKVIHPHLLERSGFFKRFLREAEIGRTIDHPNVVRTLDVDALVLSGEQQNFIVMEYVEGQTLDTLLGELRRVPEELCRHIGREMAKGIGAIHEAGAIHRDLKPANVIITEDHVVKIMDLGVARLVDEALRISQTGLFVGSVLYASPEQLRDGSTGLDARSDLYAIGLILYELFAGVHPFPAGSLPEALRLVLHTRHRDLRAYGPPPTPFFRMLVNRLLAKKRRNRFPSAAELVAALEGGEKSAWWLREPDRRGAEPGTPPRRLRVPRQTALRGRDEELAALRARFGEVLEGHGRVLVLDGEAGIGKTRLVDDFVRGLSEDGEDVNFLFGGYAPGGAATAVGAFAAAFGDHLGGAGSGPWLAETPLLVPAFDALLRGEPAPEGEEPLTRDSLQAVFVHAARALSRDRPTIVLIEDLHSAPTEGLALFAALALAIPGHRVLLVGTTRPGLPEKWRAALVRLVHASAVHLDRLGPDDLGALLTDVLRSDRLADELRPQIATLTDGNPFFLFETVRSLQARRMISKREDGSFTTTGAIRRIDLPDSLGEIIGARIADLSAEERELLEIAACCGFRFDPELVASAAGGDVIPVLRLLGRVERERRIVRSVGDAFVFDHHQLREALRNGLSAPLRRRYHGAIAQAIESRGAAPAVAFDLCRQYFDAGLPERALPHLESAIDALVERYEIGPAAALTARALEVDGLLVGEARAGILLRQADHLDSLGRRVAERDAVDEALRIAREVGDEGLTSRALASRGWLGVRTADYRAAVDDLESALALAREAGDGPGEMHATGHLGVALSRIGRHEEAIAHLGRQLELARDAGDRAAEGAARGSLGLVYRRVGRLDEAKAEIEAHLALAKESDDRQGVATATGNLGLIASSAGLADEALAHHRRHLALAREIGDRTGEGVAHGNLGLVLVRLGRFEEARESQERHLDLARETGDRQGEATTSGNLAVVLSSLGLYAEGLAAFDAWRELARELGDRQGETVALVNAGLLTTALGRTGEARRAFEDASAIGEEIGARVFSGYALQGLAAVAHQEGDEATALRLTEESLAIRREIHDVPGTSTSLVVLSRLLAERGDVPGAIESIQEGLALALSTQRPDLVLPARVGRAALPGGDTSAAQAAFSDLGDRVSVADRMEAAFRLHAVTRDPTLLDAAERLLRHLRENAPPEDRDAMIDRVPLHRAIHRAAKRGG